MDLGYAGLSNTTLLAGHNKVYAYDSSKDRFKFHIVGSGSELENVKKLATELKTDNVVFYGQRPLEDMP